MAYLRQMSGADIDEESHAELKLHQLAIGQKYLSTRIEQIFKAALELVPEQRAQFLAEACADNPNLRGEVESLLNAHEKASHVNEGLASDVAADLSADTSHAVPLRSIGPFTIEDKLGAGGMGEVYLARDKLGRKVALKLLTPKFRNDQSEVARFQQEAHTLLALNHPNIVTIYDIGEVDSVYYIASELVEGETLRELIQKRDLNLHEVLEIAIQVATGLAAAHEKGIVHRDIKPENIMIRRDGYVKVVDFGIAKLTGLQAATEPEAPTIPQVHTAQGTVVGTVAYMSPEQARGLKVDARTDVWSLGVVLYEAIARRKPFWEKTTQDLIGSILKTEPAPLARYASEVPETFEWIVSRALRKEKEARYQTATELLLDLKELRKKLEYENSVATESLGSPRVTAEADTRSVATMGSNAHPESLITKVNRYKSSLIIGLLLMAGIVVVLTNYLRAKSPNVAIESIAVLPFQNGSGNPDLEYLSDGMTESLINSLSQLPNLSVKAPGTVFRYKAKEVDPQRVATELSVQAILNGRVVQRGDDLTLYLSLVEASSGNQIWGEEYNRKLADLVALQGEIARDVSQKLRARLSAPEEQKVAKNYTSSSEAYQLYLRGRYHLVRLSIPELQTAIAYFQKAVELDPNYPLAYVGLATAYRALTLSGELPTTELSLKAKAVAQKAVELDDTLAEAHAALGIVSYFYDWKWQEADNEFKRALQLNPNSSDAHQWYAIMLIGVGRHSEAVAEIRRAREIDPLNLLINAQEVQVLFYARQTDQALASAQKALELDPNYWFVRLWASAAYAEKGMFAEAISEARAARQIRQVGSHATAFLAYALAKSGKKAEARAELDELLKLSKQRYVSSYNIALIYSGLGDHEQALAWLERGVDERDPKMVVLKVDPKLNDLHNDPQFQVLLRRVGL